jgi:nucleoside-diphosphate-sugar epimerase
MTDQATLVEAVKGVDAVVHLAAYYTFTGDATRYEEVNVKGTKKLLDAMKSERVSRLLYCSTTEVMGPTGETPANESTPPSPVYEYGRSKLKCEKLVNEQGSFGMNCTILRPSGIYGPRNVDDVSYWFIKSFGTSSLGKMVIGDGKKLIQFVHVDDVVNGFVLALKRPEVSAGQTYIISDSRAYSYNEVYSILAKVFGRTPPRLHVPLPLAKAMVAPVEGWNRLTGKDDFIWRRTTLDTFKVHRNYSIAKAERELDYHPAHPLPQGLEETVRWYQANGIM